jgi:hypothetical protein
MELHKRFEERIDTMKSDLTFTDDLVKLVDIVAELNISRTQSIKTLIIEKNGNKYISFQKWWRESDDKPWREGKGFHLDGSETAEVIRGLTKAIKVLD